MTYSILITNTRKQGTTPDGFCKGGEELVALLKELTGEHFPSSHTRNYIKRIEGPRAEGNSELNPTTPAIVVAGMGTQADADWDCISKLDWADEAAFKAYIGVMMQPDTLVKIQEAEAKVVDPSKTKIVVLGETFVTKSG
ncbi:hypothetical protein QBC37DRAFT_397652 [Rhypophila decipiens]|uniref:Uncharacterized protein n=1 Tax=Rhypophila decipiens TaxID=261697 RepID=A0AAN7BAU9_9PEZI|nr:hypothetical protein QBC37DRAFT_397652 [Rhypophila decipiens]